MNNNFLKEFSIKNIKLKNRIVFPAIGTNFANEDGSLNERILRHYRSIAQGGAGLIVTEITRVDSQYGSSLKKQLRAETMDDVKNLKPLASLAHSEGAKILLQLQHPGLQAPKNLLEDPNKLPIAPSNFFIEGRKLAREMTDREVQVIINKFALSSKIAELAGFDGVELHAAHGYLLSQFLSPNINKRTDKYGGNVYSRANILVEIIAAIRQFCREDFIISVRINGDDFLESGFTLDDATTTSKILEDSSCDMINVSSGTPFSPKSKSTIIEPSNFKEGWKKNLAKTIKENINIPVIACNNIKNPSTIDTLFKEGVSDLFAVGRGQVADYNYVNKIISGKHSEINKCISCLSCIKSLVAGESLTCPINQDISKR